MAYFIRRDEREQVEELILDHVYTVYKAWGGKHGAEPTLPATYLLDYALQHGDCPDGLRYQTRKSQQAIVRSVLRTSVEGGRLTTSLGSGRGNREVRCYEPVAMARFPLTQSAR